MLIFGISLIGSKDYSVTFFLKSSVTHPSFIIKGQPVKEGETYTISDSDNETKTDDITTVAELYDYMEKSGFQFKFYDGYDRDEVDRTIKDIQDTN